MSNSDTLLAEVKSFDERMIDLMRANVGLLLTEEELQKIMTRGIEELFFKERKVIPNPHRPTDYRMEPALMEVALLDIVRAKVPDALNLWFKDNPEKIQELINNCVGANVEQFLAKAIAGLFQNSFQNMQWSIQSNILQQIQPQR